MTSEFGIAVHTLVYLNHMNTTLPSEALAENVCTNPARIRKVIAKLKKGGLVDTKEGLNGGCHVVRPAGDITLGQVCRTLGEEMVKTSWKPGDPHMECLVASGMAGILDDIYTGLNEVCVNYLDHITIADIDRIIFEAGTSGKPAKGCGAHRKQPVRKPSDFKEKTEIMMRR